MAIENRHLSYFGIYIFDYNRPAFTGGTDLLQISMAARDDLSTAG